ncbi:aspartate/glutamate racemase family protein [Pseudidiomarina andamanensis]|uniref:Aspartate/glutamate racemase family protein n=1 Tax=Pseudidiomarina andamanensis TaxID=1940690 RepID=A0AA92IL10_9GAMM|nr:aspartate/glutamate racemase family protein [Pseudidiomarina andamanensis]MDS0218077.1 aspartate/glutamate racemase family protein [Pseudidiomarina andamanensis]QGT94963.1 aspartate/glutamate racemase family protein [Pseudidiomarina andamanensis]
MKTIGIIGGMSWESTQTYYRLINQKVREQLGGLHSAKVILYSVDFAEIEPLQHAGDWAGTADILAEAAQALETAGADFIVLATNTMHKVSPEIELAVNIPLLHIADATAAALQVDNITTVGLLGTKFTMEQDFYRDRLESHGICVVVPELRERNRIHEVIFKELCLGKAVPQSKTDYLNIINKLAEYGADAIILGCTEIGLLISQADTKIKLYDTTEIHADQAVKFALS